MIILTKLLCTYCKQGKSVDIHGLPMCSAHEREWKRNLTKFSKYSSNFYVEKNEETLKEMRE